jgi:DNA-binding response OmpR family regulator
MPSRALIVDDEPAICDLIEGVLVSTGLDVISVTKSKDAVALLRDEKFAVVLLDYRMPTPSGLDIARLMRTSGINLMTPIIFMSDDQSIAAVSEGFAAGGSLFLYKPIDKTRLLRLARSSQGAIEHERRRFSRVSIRCGVRVGFDKEELVCETIDLSLSGMLVEGPRILAVGSCVRISLETAPNVKPILGSGYVVRVLANNRMGIQLSRLPAAENARLQEFLLPLILQSTRQPKPVSQESGMLTTHRTSFGTG